MLNTNRATFKLTNIVSTSPINAPLAANLSKIAPIKAKAKLVNGPAAAMIAAPKSP